MPLADIRAGPRAAAPAPVPSKKPSIFTMPHTPTRIFALDPTTKGFGYVIFELPFRLVAWGLASISGEKHSGAIARFTKLLDHSQPDALVLEDPRRPARAGATGCGG